MPRLRRLVEERLEAAFAEVETHAELRAPQALPILLQLRDVTLRGGKRLRAGLIMAEFSGGDAMGKADDEAVVDVAAALELFQSYLLIHDDWMDGDTVRRGGPAAHVALADAFGSAHQGAVGAILAGDLASGLAQGLLASAHVPAERLHAVIREFTDLQRQVALGQMLDIANSAAHDVLCTLKTGSYTVRGPLFLGLAAAGHAAAKQALMAFAQPLGIAFQLRDDVLGLFGQEAQTGKSSGADLRAGKPTALMQRALASLFSEAERRELTSLQGQADAASLERARDLVMRSGALAHTEERIQRLHQQAMQALECLRFERAAQRCCGRSPPN